MVLRRRKSRERVGDYNKSCSQTTTFAELTAQRMRPTVKFRAVLGARRNDSQLTAP
jgi:hypothetical protein